jgi:hypothetical protein
VTRDNYAEAVDLFERALALDPRSLARLIHESADLGWRR